MGKHRLTGSLDGDKNVIKNKLNHSTDLIERPLRIGGRKDAVVFYMGGVTDTVIIHEYIIRPLMGILSPYTGFCGGEAGKVKPLSPIKKGFSSLFKERFFGGFDEKKQKGKASDRIKEKSPDGKEQEDDRYATQDGDDGTGRNGGEYNVEQDGKSEFISYLMENIIGAGELKTEADIDLLCSALIYGDCIILIEGETAAICAACKKWDKRAIAEPPTSAVLRGPREGFTEDFKANTVQLRRILRTPDFIIKQIQIGRYTNTHVAVAYIKGIADESIADKVIKRLEMIDIDGIIDSYYIQHFLEQKKNSVFKQVNNSEKPDIVAARLLEGRIAVLVDGSPIVLTLPYMFLEDLQSSQDYYNRKEQGTFSVIVRSFALVIGMILPGYYVAIQAFHYDIISIKMLSMLTNAIQSTPLPPLQEMILVSILFIIIYDASLRMPRYVGMAVSIVGALVLGDTAVKAGLISSPSVLIAAVSTLSSQLVPEQVGLTNILRLGFLLIGGLMGVFGIIAGAMLLLAHMTSLDSYGTPFLAPFSPLIKADLKDAFIKEDLGNMKTRPYAIPGTNKTRINDE